MFFRTFYSLWLEDLLDDRLPERVCDKSINYYINSIAF